MTRPVVPPPGPCPVDAWNYLPIRVRAPAEPTGYRRIDRRTCPECGAMGRPVRIDGRKSSTLAEHRPETPDSSSGGVPMAPVDQAGR